MIQGIPGWCILLGICALLPPTFPLENPETPKPGREDLGSPLWDSQGCGVTFHTPHPCPSSRGSPDSRRELERLRELLEDTKATLRAVEVAATGEDNGTSFQDFITQALPAIHEAHLEFRESLDNARRELEAHAEHPGVAEKKEELRQGVRVVSHLLLLTARLALGLDGTARQIQGQLQLHGETVAGTGNGDGTGTPAGIPSFPSSPSPRAHS